MAFNNVLRKGLSASCSQLQLEMVGERPPAAFGGSPLTEGENKLISRSERGGRSNTISNCWRSVCQTGNRRFLKTSVCDTSAACDTTGVR